MVHSSLNLQTEVHYFMNFPLSSETVWMFISLCWPHLKIWSSAVCVDWKTCLLQVVPDCSNAFLYLAKLNFDYCPAYSLCTPSTGFLSFRAFNLCLAHVRVQLILPCVCNTIFFRSCRSWTSLQILIDTQGQCLPLFHQYFIVIFLLQSTQHVFSGAVALNFFLSRLKGYLVHFYNMSGHPRSCSNKDLWLTLASYSLSTATEFKWVISQRHEDLPKHKPLWIQCL